VYLLPLISLIDYLLHFYPTNLHMRFFSNACHLILILEFLGVYVLHPLLLNLDQNLIPMSNLLFFLDTILVSKDINF
jgi:hypothetical protein